MFGPTAPLRAVLAADTFAVAVGDEVESIRWKVAVAAAEAARGAGSGEAPNAASEAGADVPKAA
jgi:hypothetical protein